LLSGIFGESLLNNCKKCTEKQKAIMDTAFDWYSKNKPEEWQEVVAKTLEDLRKKNAN